MLNFLVRNAWWLAPVLGPSIGGGLLMLSMRFWGHGRQGWMYACWAAAFALVVLTLWAGLTLRPDA